MQIARALRAGGGDEAVEGHDVVAGGLNSGAARELRYF
jgi:hypothetical protein